MENLEILNIIINCVLFMLMFRLGQHSMAQHINRLQNQAPSSRVHENNVITLEEINGVFYAYCDHDFIAQGKNIEELCESIVKRFPERFKNASVVFASPDHEHAQTKIKHTRTQL